MRLSDVMGAMGLQIWAEVGLVTFLALFAGVLAYTLSRRRHATFERARRLPLDDDAGEGTR